MHLFSVCCHLLVWLDRGGERGYNHVKLFGCDTMRATKRGWFLFSPADAEAVSRRVNRWAQQGWDLAEETDGRRFFVSLERTNRKELMYHVEPAMPGRTAENLRKHVQEREALGWEPVATLNGMDLYRSKPCCIPQAVPRTQQRRAVFVVEGAKLFFWLLLTVLAFYIRTTQEAWYLSHLGIFWHVAAFPMAFFTVLFLLWFVVKWDVPSANHDVFLWLRSGLSVVSRFGVWLFLCCLALDWMPLGYAVALMLVGTLLVLCLHSRRHMVVSPTLLQVLVIGVGVVLAGSLHTILPGTYIPIQDTLSAEDFQLTTGQLDYQESDQQGSLLVTELNYGESWSDDVYFSGETYRCYSPGMAKKVMGDLLARRGELEDVDLWYSEDGSHLLFRQGCYVVKLWVTNTDLRGEETLQVIQSYCDSLSRN